MEQSYVEKCCQYCGTLFETVRADAKFCSKKHRMKAHRLTKTHVRMIAINQLELQRLEEKFFGRKFFEIMFSSISFRNHAYENVAVFYVMKNDFKQVYKLSNDSEIPNTPIGTDWAIYYFEDFGVLN